MKNPRSKDVAQQDQPKNLNREEDIVERIVYEKLERFFAGPLPPPEHMQGYKNVQDDLPNRIMAMTEKEQAHRHQITSKTVDRDYSLRKQVSFLAFILIIFLMGTGALLLYTGKDPAGYVSMLTAVGMLISAFLMQKKPKEKNQDKLKG